MLRPAGHWFPETVERFVILILFRPVLSCQDGLSAVAFVRPKLLGDGMSPTALTWAFASWAAKSSGYTLTSANVIIVSGHGRGFSVQKNHALVSVLAGQDKDITQSYSNFGLGDADGG
jgi:hypothetical protein